MSEITLSTKDDPRALLMAAARAGYVIDQVRINGRPTDVGPFREAGLRAQTPDDTPRIQDAIDAAEKAEIARDAMDDAGAPNVLAGVNFADNSSAGELAIDEGLTAADFEGREPSGKTGFTKGDVRKILRERDGDEA